MMKKSHTFIVFFSAVIIVGHFISGTATAEERLHQKHQFNADGFSAPLSSPDELTQTSFLESREMTIASAAVVVGLFGLNWLLSQSKAKQKSTKADDTKPKEKSAEPTIVEVVKLEKPKEKSAEPTIVEVVKLEKPQEKSVEPTIAEEKKNSEPPNDKPDNKEQADKKEEKVTVQVTEKEGKKEVKVATQ
ncbi:MAG: hypothetical protein WBA13_23125 [Microcoleaceae cyanobacterium]